MDNGVAVAIVAGVLALAFAGWAIYNWGPGVKRRTVHCPEKKVPAEVDVVQKEGSFGALVDADVASCSLLPGGPVDCGKECLR